MDTPARFHVLATVAATASAVALAAGLAWVQASPPSVAPELAGSMSDLQHHTHKLMLSVDAENAALAEFYLHEVGEVTQQIERLFPEHDGIPVAALAGEHLVPRLASLDAALERASWDEARHAVGALVAACNDCHAAAGHGFIRVERTTANPFNQSFAPSAASAPPAGDREGR